MSYIEFREGPAKPKTRTWAVSAKDDGAYLGRVAWYASWRCYAFFPTPETIFERHCLRDIATFCDQQTTKHRQDRLLLKGAA